jgi:hypothetical protein
MTLWTPEGLWTKARLCIQRAQAHEASSADRALWEAVAIEFLARTALATIHPVLLADPQDAKNILYVFGVPTETPKSIPAKTLFARCRALVANFTDEHVKFCTALCERRNEELHSGGLSFETFPRRVWQPDYYDAAKVLLASIGRDLDDFLGPEEGGAAETVLSERAAEFRDEVHRAITAARIAFEALGVDEQTLLRADADEEVSELTETRERAARRSPPTLAAFADFVSCPACAATAVIAGEPIRKTGEAFDEDSGQVAVKYEVLPIGLECKSCGLEMRGFGRMHAAELSGAYEVQHLFDPVQYYGIEIDPADYFEPDYGND